MAQQKAAADAKTLEVAEAALLMLGKVCGQRAALPAGLRLGPASCTMEAACVKDTACTIFSSRCVITQGACRGGLVRPASMQSRDCNALTQCSQC